MKRKIFFSRRYFFQLVKKMAQTPQIVGGLFLLSFFVLSFLLNRQLTALRKRNHEIMRQINDIQEKHLK